MSPHHMFRRQPVVLLKVLREQGGLFFGRRRVGCGFEPEMRKIWEGFLTIAGVPKE